MIYTEMLFASFNFVLSDFKARIAAEEKCQFGIKVLDPVVQNQQGTHPLSPGQRQRDARGQIDEFKRRSI